MTCVIFGKCDRLEFISQIAERFALNSTEVWILFHLLHRANMRGYCWPSIELLARQTRASTATVKRAIARFVELELIERVVERALRAQLLTAARADPRTQTNIYQIKIEAMTRDQIDPIRSVHRDHPDPTPRDHGDPCDGIIMRPKREQEGKEVEIEGSSLRSEPAREDAREDARGAAALFDFDDDPQAEPQPPPTPSSEQNGLPALMVVVADKSSPRARPRPVTADDPTFREFYDLYPRKIAKPRALRAWNAALGKAAAETIIAALQAQLDAKLFRFDERKRFVRHPATWLNDEGWTDDIPAPTMDLGTALLWGIKPTATPEPTPPNALTVQEERRMSDPLSQVRIEFAAMLASIVAPGKDEARNLIATLMLGCADIPEAVFADPRALALRVGATFDRMPNLARLLKALQGCVAESKPAMILIGSSVDGGLDEDARFYVSAFLKRRNAGEIKNIAHALDTLRGHKPEAFAHLTRTDDECREIAERKGWIDRAPIDVSEEGVRANVASIETQIPYVTEPVGLAVLAMALSMLRTEVSRRAPELMWMVPVSLVDLRPRDVDGRRRTPDEQRAALGAVIAKAASSRLAAEHEARTGRVIGAVSPEYLAQLRAQHGPRVGVPAPRIPIPENMIVVHADVPILDPVAPPANDPVPAIDPEVAALFEF